MYKPSLAVGCQSVCGPEWRQRPCWSGWEGSPGGWGFPASLLLLATVGPIFYPVIAVCPAADLPSRSGGPLGLKKMQIKARMRYRFILTQFSSVQFCCSVMSDSLQPHGLQHAGFPVHHQLLKPAKNHIHRVSDAIQPSHPLSSPSPPTFNLSQHQGLF